MLVEYKPVAGGTYALLFDESAGAGNERFNPQFRDNVMKPGGYGAASSPKIPLNNTLGTITFKWNANYDTADLAKASIRALRAALKGVPVHLQVTQGTDVDYYPNAILSQSSHEIYGREAIHTLTFETDDVTATAP